MSFAAFRSAGAPAPTNRLRYKALTSGWYECGDLISFGTFVGAVEAYERALREVDLDAQYEYERSRDKRQQANDHEAEQEILEARRHNAQRADQ